MSRFEIDSHTDHEYDRVSSRKWRGPRSMGVFQRCTMLVMVVCTAAACTARSSFSRQGSAGKGSEAIPPGLTCPVMTKVEYDHARYKTMIGASPENPMICQVKRTVGTPELLVMNWYAVDRLRSSDVDHAIEVLSSIVTGPVGFTTSWNRFLGSNQFPYQTQFVVAPDQTITVGGKSYDVRVVRAGSAYEDNEYWIDRNSLMILKYVDHNTASRNYTVTALVKVPAS